MDDTARPPYIAFEKRPVEDREASIIAGHFVSKDVVYVMVTPAGTKDRLEKVADDWLRDSEESVRQERLPPEWFDAYKRKYEAYLRNEEVPEEGTPIREWPVVSPAQAKNVLNANIRTVEDLAEATEEALSRIGMGARGLKDKAKTWLELADKKGKPAERINALEQDNATLKARNDELEARLIKLEAAQKTTEPAE